MVIMNSLIILNTYFQFVIDSILINGYRILLLGSWNFGSDLNPFYGLIL